MDYLKNQSNREQNISNIGTKNKSIFQLVKISLNG
jgi:hypothetical protein